jgi:hypothetical protein
MLNTKTTIKFNTDVTLNKYRVWNIDGDRRGDVIHCSYGTLWITQEGDMKDYILDAGQDFWVTRSGTVIVQALDDSKFQFSLNEVENHLEINQQPIHNTHRTQISQRTR